MAQELTYRQWVVPEEWRREESRMLERARTDPVAFAPIYERYFPRIYAYCLRRVGSPEDAEDLASLVFSRALAGRSGYRGGSVASWLFTIAHNAVANHLRGRRPHLSLDAMAFSEADAVAWNDDPVLDRLIREEERARIARLVAALPEEQREVLNLKLAGRLSAREIGAVLGKREGAVRVMLYRIVQQLRAANQRLDAEHPG